MANYNKVLLMGNLTRDIELKFTPSGLAIGSTGLAVNRRFRDTKTNELREEVTFVDVDMFGKTAETAHQYLAKGRPIFIEGRLKYDQWDDKQTGQKRSRLKVVAERFQFIGANPNAGQGAAASGAPRSEGARPLPPRPTAPVAGGPENTDQQPPEDLEIQEENIPF